MEREQELEALKARLSGYRWLRWFVTFIFAVGIGLSVLLQVLHAPEAGGWVAKVLGGVPPVAVFLCVEMIARIPIFRKLAGWTRVLIAAAVAGMAIVVSYEQQYDYVLSLAFAGLAVYLYPLIIDGVMFVATLSLVEVTRQVRLLKEEIAVLSAILSIPAAPAPAEAEPVPVHEVVHAESSAQSTPTRRPVGRPPGPQAPARRRSARNRFLGSGGLPPREDPVEATVVQDPDPQPVATDAQAGEVTKVKSPEDTSDVS